MIFFLGGVIGFRGVGFFGNLGLLFSVFNFRLGGDVIEKEGFSLFFGFLVVRRENRKLVEFSKFLLRVVGVRIIFGF